MESAWDAYADEYVDDEDIREECPLYKTQRDLFKAHEAVTASEECSQLLDRHGGKGLVSFKWKSSRGLPIYAILGEMTEEACRMDHVKEEHRMTFTVPMQGAYPEDKPFDRNSLPSFQWVNTDELTTLHRLLGSSSDFVRIQVLSCLKEWASTGLHKRFCNEPDILSAIGRLIFESENCGVMRMAACVISLIAKNAKLRLQFLNPNGTVLLTELFKLVNGQKQIKDEGSRWLVAKALAQMTTDDLYFTGYLIRNFKLDSLFNVLSTATNSFFKMNVLTLLYNLVQHPLGLEKITSQEDFKFEPILKAFCSIVPKYHKAGFQMLDILLRTSREPLQSKLHRKFFAEKGLLMIMALLEEVFDLDRKVAINALVLLDHLADSDVGRHALVTSALNMLRSIVYFRHSRPPKQSIRSFSKKREPSLLTIGTSSKYYPKIAKKSKNISDAIYNTVTEAKAIDEYNSPETKPILSAFLPLDYSFMEDEGQSSVFSPTKRNQGSRKQEQRPLSPLTEKSSIMSVTKLSMRGSLRVWDRRIKKRSITKKKGLLDVAAFNGDNTSSAKLDYVSKVDNNVRCLAMEVLSKLAGHPLGAKLLIGLVRNLCPLLKRYSKDTVVAESVGYCIQYLFANNYSSLKPMLDHYYLIRELSTVLNMEMEERAKASLVGAIAVLLKQSCRLVYTMTGFSLRKPILYWLRLAPEETPDYVCLYSLMVVYSLSRYYKRRDFVICKTLVRCLINILQNEATEEQCRIYAACSLAFLTFGNKRYRKLGSDAFSVEKESLLLRYSVPELSHMLPEEASDEEVPAPTSDSFKPTILLDDTFFIQVCERSVESPVNLFHIFLLDILLKRATSIWGKVVLANFQKIMKWLRKCIKEKQSMSRHLYRTLMESIPTLSFYYHNEVDFWTKIDEQPFYVCVDPDVRQSFPGFLLREGEVCPRCYIVYKLDKDEYTRSFPWDSYWKERTEPPEASPFIAPSVKSVLLDSIFGFGGFYKEDISIVMRNVLNKRHRGPFFEPRTIIEYCSKDITRPNRSSLRRRSLSYLHPSVLTSKPRKAQAFQKKYLLTLQRYIKNLTHTSTRPINEEKLRKIAGFVLSHSSEKRIRKRLFSAILDFYENPVKQFSQYQFKLFVEALSTPSKLWLDAVDDNCKVTYWKLEKFKRSLAYFPNFMLQGIENVIFHGAGENNSLDISVEENDIYKEPMVLIISTIIAAYEKLSGKKFSFPRTEKADDVQIQNVDIGPRIGYSLKKSIYNRSSKSAFKTTVYRSPTMSKQTYFFTSDFNEWSFNLGSYGRAFFEFFNKHFSENVAKAVLKYSFEESDLFPMTRRRSSNITKYRTALAKFQDNSSLIKTYGGIYMDCTSGAHMPRFLDNEWEKDNSFSRETAKRDSEFEIKLDGRTKPKYADERKIFDGSGPTTMSQSKAFSLARPISKVDMDDMYVPTRREIMIDFFTQPHDPELRRPYSKSPCYSRTNSKSFVGSMTEKLFKALSNQVSQEIPNMPMEWSEFNLNFNTTLYRKSCNLIINEHLNRIKNLDYEYFKRSVCSSGEFSCLEKVQSFHELIKSIHLETMDILKRDSRSGCWYQDIIKMIAKNVCKRLEGPFGYVTEYLMRQHRNQLKWRLGTSVIPMGYLRIGGQLERAIIFKFLADQMMIPCKIRRSSLAVTWVEVPLKPFQYHKSPTSYVVDLEKSPGKLTRNLHSSSEVKSCITEEASDQKQIYDDDFLDNILCYMEKKGGLIRWENQQVEAHSELTSSSSSGNVLENEKPEEEASQEVLSPCSSPLTWEFMNDASSRNITGSGHLSPVRTQSPKNSPDTREKSNKKKKARNAKYTMFCWRNDPDGRYTTIIGRVPARSVSGGTKAEKHPNIKQSRKSEGPEYSTTSGPLLLEKLLTDRTPFKGTPTVSDPDVTGGEMSDIDDVYAEWIEIVKTLSDYKITPSD